MAPILGYWKVRGLTHQIRLFFHYIGVEFVDKQYDIGSAPDYLSKEWVSDKLSLGLSFPNLPYLIDGDFKLTQSSAILEYIADKHGLLPTTPKERAVLHMIYQQIHDLRISFIRMCYSPDFEILKEGFLNSISKQFELWSDYLKERSWASGDKVNFPDCAVYDVLDMLRVFEPTCLVEFPVLQEYIKKFEALPGIREYIASDSYLKGPFTGPMAKWRGDV